VFSQFILHTTTTTTNRITAFYITAAPVAADLMLSAAQAGFALPTATSGKQAVETITT